MGQRVSYQNYVSAIAELVRSTLRNKQIELLIKISLNNGANVTKLVDILSAETNASKTSIWYNLRKLKSFGLIDFGSAINKGRPAKLTQLGLRIKEVIENADS